jgi:signal peptidase I
MDTPVVIPEVLDFGTVAPGLGITQQSQLYAPSESRVTAEIVHDLAHVFRVREVTAYDLLEEAGAPVVATGPPKLPSAGASVASIPFHFSSSDGRTPLSVRPGQLVAVDVDVDPVAGGEDVLVGLLEIRGTNWTSVRQLLRVTVGDVGPFTMEDVSMEPALHKDQVVQVDTTAFRHHIPRRGDIVVFWLAPGGLPHLRTAKRVIALPGDSIKVREGAVHVNRQRLSEPYVLEPAPYTMEPRRVPPGSYFVLGDNRNRSYDSSKWPRTWLPHKNLIGRVEPTR